MRKILMIGFIALALVLVGCDSKTMQLYADGSVKAIIEVANDGWTSLEEIENELENRFEDEEGFSNLSVRETDQHFQVGFEFESINNVNRYAYQIPVADYVITNDNRLNYLVMVEGQEDFSKTSTSIFVRLPGEFENLEDAKVIFPGDVVAHSENMEVVEENAVEIDHHGRTYIVFEPKNNMGMVGWGFILATPIVLGGVLFSTRKRRNRQEDNKVKKGEGLA